MIITLQRTRTITRNRVHHVSSVLITMALATSNKSSCVRALSVAQSFLKNPDLLPNDSSKDSFPVYNPAKSNQVIQNVRTMTQQDAKEAIEKATHVAEHIANGVTAKQRAQWLSKWSQLIDQNKQDIATIMTLESGKPLKESLGEVAYGRSFLDFYAAEATRATGQGGGFLMPTPFDVHGAPSGTVMAIQQAVGVTAMITPWNFPIAMITRKVGPAIAAGCPAVVKPSELTPLTALAIERLAWEAGIPPEAFQIVTPDQGETPKVGEEFCTNPNVRKISFTGSTPVGKTLLKWSSDTVKRASMELGGNAPFVIFADADIENAVDAAVASKFRNAGQTCVCADRFLVQRDVYEDFLERFRDKVCKLRVGNGMDKGVDMGPLISEKACETVSEKVAEAIENGAKCEVGGERLEDLGPQFYAPTILSNVSVESRIWKTETFGPVAAVRSFDDEDEALTIANDSEVGLSSYFCTSDLDRTFRFARRLEAGIVSVNGGIFSTAVAPFGGVKESGLGREGSSLGISEYLETKYILIN